MDAANALTALPRGGGGQLHPPVRRLHEPDDVLAMVRDPDIRFSTTPARLMQYAEFMHGVGSIRVQPARWSEMFVEALAGRDGS